MRFTIQKSAGILVALLITACNSENTAEKVAPQLIMFNLNNFASFPAVYSMVAKSNASADWPKSLGEKVGPFTIDVEIALKNSGKPILFVSQLDDIERRDGMYLLHFGNPIIKNLDLSEIRLRCSPEQFESLFKRSRFFESYAVIASISSVRKVRFVSLDDSDGEQVEIDRSVVAEGQFLDALPTEGLEQRPQPNTKSH